MLPAPASPLRRLLSLTADVAPPAARGLVCVPSSGVAVAVAVTAAALTPPLAVRRGEPWDAAAASARPPLVVRRGGFAPPAVDEDGAPAAESVTCSFAGRRWTKRLMAPPKSAERMATS